MDEALQRLVFVLGLLSARADDERQSGENFQAVRFAAELRHAALQVIVEAAALFDSRIGREDNLRGLRREIPARVRGSGLDQHRPSLRCPRNVESPMDIEELAMVIEYMELRQIEVPPLRPIMHEGIILPAVP